MEGPPAPDPNGDQIRGRFKAAIPADRPQCLMAHWKRKLSHRTKPPEESSRRRPRCGRCYSAERRGQSSWKITKQS
eukprot:1951957-Pyramimonas_sp.AAC.1